MLLNPLPSHPPQFVPITSTIAVGRQARARHRPQRTNRLLRMIEKTTCRASAEVVMHRQHHRESKPHACRNHTRRQRLGPCVYVDNRVVRRKLRHQLRKLRRRLLIPDARTGRAQPVRIVQYLVLKKTTNLQIRDSSQTRIDGTDRAKQNDPVPQGRQRLGASQAYLARPAVHIGEIIDQHNVHSNGGLPSSPDLKRKQIAYSGWMQISGFPPSNPVAQAPLRAWWGKSNPRCPVTGHDFSRAKNANQIDRA